MAAGLGFRCSLPFLFCFDIIALFSLRFLLQDVRLKLKRLLSRCVRLLLSRLSLKVRKRN